MKWSTNRRTKCGQSVMRIKTAYYAFDYEVYFLKKIALYLYFCGFCTIKQLKPCGKFLVGIQF